jgi:uncharacterized BrkB/YihY/UPF0761 family membrane protein
MTENNKKKKDNSLLIGCGGIILFGLVITVVGIVGSLILHGRNAAHAMFDKEEDNPIDFLQWGTIILVVIGIIYLIRKYND